MSCFVTVDGLIEMLQEISKEGYGKNLIVDSENDDYNCTGVSLGKSYDDEDEENDCFEPNCRNCVKLNFDEYDEGSDE